MTTQDTGILDFPDQQHISQQLN